LIVLIKLTPFPFFFFSFYFDEPPAGKAVKPLASGNSSLDQEALHSIAYLEENIDLLKKVFGKLVFS